MKKVSNCGAICGGVISESKYLSNPWAYMMAWRLPDDKYAKYIAEKDEKKKRRIFEKYARSSI